MDTAALDFGALLLAIALALVITVGSLLASRGDARRLWITAAALAAGMLVLGALDLAREDPRETPFVAIAIGAILPALGAAGVTRAAQGLRWWLRGPLVFAVTLVLLLGGLILGAAVIPRWFGPAP